MIFLKKFIIGLMAIGFIFLGGAATQTNSTLLQGSGFIGLVVGLVALYIFGKMVWRAMGCLPSILIVIAVLAFIIYAIGGFSGGIGNLGTNLNSIMGRKQVSSTQIMASAEQPSISEEQEIPSETKQDVVNLVGEDQHPILMENIAKSIMPKINSQPQKRAFNPLDYPHITGVSRVVSGDTITIGRYIIKLFGVAAPDISQTCASSSGAGYRCGQQSISWLSEWLADNEITCHIINKTERGILNGVCLLGDYDIGAAIVNAGWAVADARQNAIYVPYQQQASANRRGLWEGEFYMPWDWQRIKNRKANIKILTPKNKSKRRKAWLNPFR